MVFIGSGGWQSNISDGGALLVEDDALVGRQGENSTYNATVAAARLVNSCGR